MTVGASPHRLADLGVVMVAAGRGERLGADRPKGFVKLGGRTLLEHSLRTIIALPHGGHAVLVVPEACAAEALDIAGEAMESTATADRAWQVSVTTGGRERHESVRNGLDALSESIETVLVHDAARPLTPRAVFQRVIDAVHETRGAVVPALPVADTLKRLADDGTVAATVDRSELVAVQTPQGFPRELLVGAHEAHTAAATSSSPTDDAELVQRFGGTVHTVPGDQLAHKLTTASDIVILAALHAARLGDCP